MDIDLLIEGLEKSESLPSDFLEIRFDDLLLRTLDKENDNWKEILTNRRRGIGVASYVNGTMGYASTSILTPEAIFEAASRATKLASVSSEIASIKLKFEPENPIVEKLSAPFKIQKHPKDTSLEDKVDLIERGMDVAKEAGGKQVSLVNGLYGEMFGKKLFVNSEGSKIEWDFLLNELRFIVIAKGIDGLVTGMDSHGGSLGLESYNNGTSSETIAKNAGNWAKEQLNAKSCPPGDLRCVAEQSLVGVLAHESFGHLSEADFIVSKGSPLTDRLGEEIANPNVSIYDVGTPDVIKNGGLWLPFDDQGSRTTNTQIVDSGILKGYLNSRGTAAYFNDHRTGNARAINFNFFPIPRMKNTYIDKGDFSHDDLLSELKTGVYAIDSMGGTVGSDGEFLFKARRGYYVENGEIKYPIKEVSLSGNILDLLKKIEGCGDSLRLYANYFGGCGKGGQYPLQVGVGGPEILFSKVRFGGESISKNPDVGMSG